MRNSCEESLFRLIALTGQGLRSYADQRLKSFDLTVEQLKVLKHIDSKSGQSQRDLSLLTEKSPANITRILDRLQDKNMVERRQNPDDRRSSLVFLTQDGEILKNEVISLFEGLRSELVDGIDDEKQLVAFEVLKDIRSKIEKMSMIIKRGELC